MGIFSGSVNAEALSASARFGLEGDLLRQSASHNSAKGSTSQAGPTVFSMGAQAHLAKTSVTGGVRIGPVKVDLTGSVGYGAAASASVGVSRTGFSLSGQVGAGGTVGAGLRVAWDTNQLNTAIAKASVPQPLVRTSGISGGGSDTMW